MEFDNVIRIRNSTTMFKPKHSLSWKPLIEAVDAAIQGPFAGNYNNLKFVIVEDSAIISELAKHAKQGWISTASAVIVVCSDETQIENLYGERGRIYSRQQAGAAIHTITLSLANRGISSCWVGAYDDPMVRDLLKIPGKMQVEAMIPCGFPVDKPKHKRKVDLGTVTFWENWGKRRRASLFEEETNRFEN
jgi:nitroreductase